MKRPVEFDAELTELIKRTTPQNEAVLEISSQEYNFLTYPTGSAPLYSDPTRDKFFAHNHEQSKEGKFLEHAIHLLKVAIDSFDFVIREHGQAKYPYIKAALDKLQLAREEFAHIHSLDKPLADIEPIPGQPVDVYYSYQMVKGKKNRNEQVVSAICDFFLFAFLPSVYYSPIEAKTRTGDTDSVKKKERRLYSNYKEIDQARGFGIAKSIGDSLSKTIRYANKDKAIDQYQANNRVSSFKTGGKDPVTFSIDSAAMGIRAANEFGFQLMRIKDAKILQTYMALAKYTYIHDSFQFRNVPISEIMEIVLKKNSTANFNSVDRRNFSECLRYLAAITITVREKVTRPVKNGKVKTSLFEEQGVKLFRMVSEHPVKKQYQGLSKDLLIPEEHFDLTVISRFSGELLPNYNLSYTGRANIYSDALCEMDANKDQKAMVLGFELETRFNQLMDKSQPIEMQRSYLIEKCDYQKTNQANPTMATKQLQNVFDKLATRGVIGCYKNLSNIDEDKVALYPPKRPTLLLSE